MSRAPDLRILMTTDAVGGVWSYASSLTAALVERGAEVCLVTLGPPPRDDQRAMLHDQVRLIETDLALEWQDPQGDDLANARRTLGALERQVRPEIVHLNSFRDATFEWRAPVLVAAHSCANSWGLACHDSAWLSAPEWRRYSEFVAAGLKTAAAWVAPSRGYRDMVRRIYRPGRTGTVIWNGISAATSPQLRKQDFILAAGRLWDKAKNLDALAQAGSEVAWPILAAGPKPASHDENTGGLELLGNLPRNELRSLMQRASIFASPALYEPFGLSVLEAAAAGCALVLSDIPTLRELWDGAAIFVSPEDVCALRRILNGMVEDQTARSALQRAASERSQRYSLERMVDNYAGIYRELAGTTAALHALGACA